VARIGGQCRALWNLFLAENIERYRTEKKFIFYAEMSARLPKLLKTETKLVGLPHRAAQMTVQRLDFALRDCFKGAANRKGFPRFKRYDDRADAFSFVGRECRFERNRVRLPKVGWVRVRGLVLPEGADAKMIAVTQEPTGWHVSVQFAAPAKEYATPRYSLVGIDAGVRKHDAEDRTIATLRDGRRIVSPQWVEKAEKHIRRLNRERDRRRKGSVNRRRTVARLGRLHRTVRDRRVNFLHKTTTKLVRRYAGFAVEDLSLKGLIRTRLAKSFASAALGELFRQLAYKAEWAGRDWRLMPRFQRSTGVCPDCGTIGPKLLLSVRTWRCEDCGAWWDRDVAAAMVIERCAVGQALPEPAVGTRRKRGFAVRGGGRSRDRSSHGGPPANVDVVHQL
jgi:putative transposase